MKIYINNKEYENQFVVGEKQVCLDVGGGWWIKENFLLNNHFKVSFEELGLNVYATYYNDQNFSLRIVRECKIGKLGISINGGNRRYKKFKCIPNIIGIVNYKDKVEWQLKALSFKEWESENFKFNRRLYKSDTKWVAGIDALDLKFMCLHVFLDLEGFTRLVLQVIETLQRLEMMEKTRVYLKGKKGIPLKKDVKRRKEQIKKSELIDLIFSEITDESKIQYIIQGEDLNNYVFPIRRYKKEDIQKIYSWCKRNGFPREKLVYGTEVRFKYKFIDKKLVEFKRLYPQFNLRDNLLDFLYKRFLRRTKKVKNWRERVIDFLHIRSYPQRIKMYKKDKYKNQKEESQWFYIDYDLLEGKIC